MLNNQRVNKSIKVRTLPSFIIIFPGLIDSDAKTKVSLFEKISSLYNGTVIIIFFWWVKLSSSIIIFV